MTADERIAEIRKRLESATPGPWKSRRKFAQEWAIDCGQEPTLGHDKWNELATVYGCEDAPKEGAAVSQANAQLVAHAPEDLAWLLAQLAEARSTLLSVEYGYLCPAWCDRDGKCPNCQARGCLAKMDGQSEE